MSSAEAKGSRNGEDPTGSTASNGGVQGSRDLGDTISELLSNGVDIEEIDKMLDQHIAGGTERALSALYPDRNEPKKSAAASPRERELEERAKELEGELLEARNAVARGKVDISDLEAKIKLLVKDNDRLGEKQRALAQSLKLAQATAAAKTDLARELRKAFSEVKLKYGALKAKYKTDIERIKKYQEKKRQESNALRAEIDELRESARSSRDELRRSGEIKGQALAAQARLAKTEQMRDEALAQARELRRERDFYFAELKKVRGHYSELVDKHDDLGEDHNALKEALNAYIKGDSKALKQAAMRGADADESVSLDAEDDLEASTDGAVGMGLASTVSVFNVRTDVAPSPKVADRSKGKAPSDDGKANKPSTKTQGPAKQASARADSKLDKKSDKKSDKRSAAAKKPTKVSKPLAKLPPLGGPKRGTGGRSKLAPLGRPVRRGSGSSAGGRRAAGRATATSSATRRASSRSRRKKISSSGGKQVDAKFAPDKAASTKSKPGKTQPGKKAPKKGDKKLTDASAKGKAKNDAKKQGEKKTTATAVGTPSKPPKVSVDSDAARRKSMQLIRSPQAKMQRYSIKFLQYSPDGRVLAIGVSNKIVLCDADDNNTPKAMLDTGSSSVTDSEWSRDGRYLRVTDSAGSKHVFDTGGGTGLSDPKKVSQSQSLGTVAWVVTDNGPLGLARAVTSKRELARSLESLGARGPGETIEPEVGRKLLKILNIPDRDLSSIMALNGKDRKKAGSAGKSKKNDTKKGKETKAEAKNARDESTEAKGAPSKKSDSETVAAGEKEAVKTAEPPKDSPTEQKGKGSDGKGSGENAAGKGKSKKVAVEEEEEIEEELEPEDFELSDGDDFDDIELDYDGDAADGKAEGKPTKSEPGGSKPETSGTAKKKMFSA